MSDFYDIIKNGNFYYPCNLRYGKNKRVICDRCYKTNLIASIGTLNKDLCLICADTIANQMNKKIMNTQSNQNEFMTLMHQSIYKTPYMKQPDIEYDQFKTRMEQSIYRDDHILDYFPHKLRIK